MAKGYRTRRERSERLDLALRRGHGRRATQQLGRQTGALSTRGLGPADVVQRDVGPIAHRPEDAALFRPEIRRRVELGDVAGVHHDDAIVCDMSEPGDERARTGNDGHESAAVSNGSAVSDAPVRNRDQRLAAELARDGTLNLRVGGEVDRGGLQDQRELEPIARTASSSSTTCALRTSARANETSERSPTDTASVRRNGARSSVFAARPLSLVARGSLRSYLAIAESLLLW